MKSNLAQTGMTLIEIMIALLLGVFLTGGVIQIFINSKQTYRVQEALSRLQENGRLALDFIDRDLRMAGYIGCNSQAVITNTLNTPTNALYAFGTAISGFEATSSAAWTPGIANAPITNAPIGGTDVIAVRRAADQYFTITTQATSSSDLTLDATATTANLKSAGFLNANGANNCATAVASNCATAATFQISSITGTVISHTAGGSCVTPKNATADLGKTYVGGQVYPINTISYYVGTGSNGTPSLYRQIGANSADEIIEGIENLQILYGVDSDATTDGTANYYITADNVTDMSQVVSLRISLLVASIDNNISMQPVNYTYNGVTTTPTDRKIRRVFDTTIALRNRLH